MKKLLVLVALIAVAAIPSVAQTGPYLVDYFVNNDALPGQAIRLVNYGANGTPLTSPVGDVCANLYVFDANQEMVECCSCRITPNGLFSREIASLTTNPVTSVIPVNGDVKIVSTNAIPGVACTPLTYNGGITDSIVGFGTHKQIGLSPSVTLITETNIPWANLRDPEQSFLLQACQFVRYLGSTKGVCTCS